MMEATLAERGQVVIPKAIRDQLGMTPGMLLTFTVQDGKLIIRKKVDDAITRARGLFKLAPGETVDSIMRELRGRAPGDPIEPWEELRDDMYIPAAVREDHARRRATWLAQKEKPSDVTADSVKSAVTVGVPDRSAQAARNADKTDAAASPLRVVQPRARSARKSAQTKK